jgi:hypothetical protein
MGGGGASALMDEKERGWFCAVDMPGRRVGAMMMREGLFGAGGSGIFESPRRPLSGCLPVACLHELHQTILKFTTAGRRTTAFQHCPHLSLNSHSVTDAAT